jgi:hypothetical protein
LRTRWSARSTGYRSGPAHQNCTRHICLGRRRRTCGSRPRCSCRCRPGRCHWLHRRRPGRTAPSPCQHKWRRGRGFGHCTRCSDTASSAASLSWRSRSEGSRTQSTPTPPAPAPAPAAPPPTHDGEERTWHNNNRKETKHGGVLWGLLFRCVFFFGAFFTGVLSRQS